ncbi:MAG: amino acid ABC transporter permease [Clostridiales bacterium]|uniref:amino acid ABC transporter permease n=1 Tax=Chordicoccus furentiruminis TaxID=2709410 RepID=UPI0023A9004E|nr:amino acid ABC transporter permease [Chordicoccus furentiruminis]MCI6172691.1 amino acid ABC transporter permease [Clostridiales bacterium]
MGSLAQNLYDDFISKNRYRYLLDGLGNTLVITIFALIIGVVLGVLVALTRVTYQQAEHRSVLLRILNFIGGLYLTVIRGTPMVVQLMLMYFVILQSGTPLQIAILAFGINSGAYVAEVIRSGIQSVDRGQAEAGRSLGLGSRQTMTRIVLPQAFKNVAPAIFNEFISLLKETSVAGYVGIQDLTKGGDIIRSQTYDAFPPLLAVALIYLVIVICLTQVLHVIERRLAKSELR